MHQKLKAKWHMTIQLQSIYKIFYDYAIKIKYEADYIKI
jgi:hypothetical protein